MNMEVALKALEFCGIESRNEKGKASHVIVPGHEGKQYEVIISRINAKEGKKPEILVDCHEIGNEGACLGNSQGHICYHSIAALLKSCERKGFLSFFHQEIEAIAFATVKNSCFVIKSNNGSGKLYAIWHKYPKK